MGVVGKKDMARLDGLEHVGGRASVMGLTFGQLEGDRTAGGIDQGVNFCGQPAPRAPTVQDRLSFYRWQRVDARESGGAGHLDVSIAGF